MNTLNTDDAKLIERKLLTRELEEELRSIRTAIRAKDLNRTRLQAFSKLEELVAQGIPGAMHLLGYLLWEGVFITSDTENGFRLISECAATGYSPAMTTLGAMHHVGAGCPRNFELARHWYRKGGEQFSLVDNLDTVLIQGLGLGQYEFLWEYALEINGVRFEASSKLLERLNDWLLASKNRVIDKQLLMIARNPELFPGRKDCLPYKMGWPQLILAGQDSISEIGWVRGWINEEFWLSLIDFDSEIVTESNFGALETLTVIENGFSTTMSAFDAEAIRKKYQEIRATSKSASIYTRILNKFGVKVRPKVCRGTFELHIGGSGLGSYVTFKERGGADLYSVFNE